MLWLQGGRQFHSTLLDSSLQTSPLRYLVPPPCACAQCCVSWSSCPLFTSLVTSEEALRVSSVFLPVLCSDAADLSCVHMHRSGNHLIRTWNFHVKFVHSIEKDYQSGAVLQVYLPITSRTRSFSKRLSLSQMTHHQNQFRRPKVRPSFPALSVATAGTASLRCRS